MNNATHVQNKKVLDRLRHGPVTSAELTRDLDILRPSARIYDLRGEGHKIVTAWDWDHVNGTDHRVGRYVLMKETGKIESPDDAGNITEAKNQNIPGQFTKPLQEVGGMVATSLLVAVVMWASILGMSDGFQPGQDMVVPPIAEADDASR